MSLDALPRRIDLDTNVIGALWNYGGPERLYFSEGSMAAIKASGSALTTTEERLALLAA